MIHTSSIAAELLEAQSALELKRYEDVAQSANRVLQQFPEHRKANHLLAVSLYRRERYDEARQVFERLLALSNDDADAAQGLGATLAKLGREDEAIEVLTSALRLRPAFPQALRTLSAIQERMYRRSAVETSGASRSCDNNEMGSRVDTTLSAQPSHTNSHKLTIGRSPECEILLPHADVSRHHAELVDIAGSWWLRDLQSTNGTYVNGQRVQWHELKSGDQVRVASHLLALPVGAERAGGRQHREASGCVAPPSQSATVGNTAGTKSGRSADSRRGPSAKRPSGRDAPQDARERLFTELQIPQTGDEWDYYSKAIARKSRIDARAEWRAQLKAPPLWAWLVFAIFVLGGFGYAAYNEYTTKATFNHELEQEQQAFCREFTGPPAPWC